MKSVPEPEVAGREGSGAVEILEAILYDRIYFSLISTTIYAIMPVNLDVSHLRRSAKGLGIARSAAQMPGDLEGIVAYVKLRRVKKGTVLEHCACMLADP